MLRSSKSKLFTVMGLAVVAVGSTIALVRAQSPVITACVNRNSGEVKIVSGGRNCPAGSILVQWGQQGPPGPPGPSGLSNVQYVSGGIYPGTSVARAFCPPGTIVTGGGGFSTSGVGLQQNYPISDATGVIAYDSIAVGWQVAASDFSNVQAFVVCAAP